MNQLATQQERLPMDSVGVSNTSTGTKIAPQNLAEVVKFAEVMCRADIALPKHLRGNAGACMAVALQALEWQLSPFAVASKSYAVNGDIAYEAQLIAAVVNTRSGIKGRLKYRFDGQGNAMTCTVTGNLDGEECEYTSPQIGSITTKNSPLWKSDPQQQLGYFSARSWARRHCPEVILGVYDRDEAEDFRGPDKAKDITPAFDPLSDEPIEKQTALLTRQPESSVFSDEPFDQSTGEILTTDNTNSGSSPEPEQADATSSSQASVEAVGTAPLCTASPIPDDLLTHLTDFSRKALRTAEDDLPKDKKLDLIEDMLANYREVIPEAEWGKLSTIKGSIQAVLAGKRTLEQARAFIAGDLLGCDVSEIGG
jgi:hypothetical protein